jgi:hypothetical protein
MLQKFPGSRTTYIHTYVWMYIRTHIHIYIDTYIDTYIRTYICFVNPPYSHRAVGYETSHVL